MGTRVVTFITPGPLISHCFDVHNILILGWQVG